MEGFPVAEWSLLRRQNKPTCGSDSHSQQLDMEEGFLESHELELRIDLILFYFATGHTEFLCQSRVSPFHSTSSILLSVKSGTTSRRSCVFMLLRVSSSWRHVSIKVTGPSPLENRYGRFGRWLAHSLVHSSILKLTLKSSNCFTMLYISTSSPLTTPLLHMSSHVIREYI